MSGGDGSGNGGRSGLFFAVKKLLHHRSFFRSRGENHLSIGSPRKNSSPSSSIQRGTFSPSQSSLLSEESLPRNAGNELRFDIERISLKSSEDGLPNSVSSADEDSQQGHNRTTYASPVSSFTPCVSRDSSISSGSFQGEGSSPSHPHLCDGELFPTIAGNEQGFSDEIMSVKSSEGALENSDSHFSMFSLMNNVSSADADPQHGHNQTTTASPASSCTPCVSRNGSISSGAHQGEGSSMSHPRPCYGESLPIISGNAQGFDTERMLLKRFEDRLAISVSQFSTFPLMNHVPSANENSQQGLNQTSTASPASSCTPRVSRNSSISFGALINNVSSAAEDSQQGDNQTTSASPDSSCALRVSRNSSISSSAYQGEGSSLSGTHSCSGEFLPIIAFNELWFDDEIMSLESSQDRYKSMSSVHTQGYISVSPLSTISTDLRQSSFHSSAIQRESSPSRPRFSSDESLYGIPRYMLSFDMETNSHKSYEEWLTGSGKRSISSGNSSILRAAIGDGNQVYYFLSPVGLQSHLQSIFRRACGSLVPRMVSSSATEATAYRVEVENHIKKLVEDLQVTSTDVLRNAAAELQLLASLNTDNQILIANHGAISLLINLLRSVDTKLQESAVIALLHLSANDNNKCMIVDADAIEPLIRVLSTGSPEAQETSVATLFNLSDIEGFKVKICRAIKAVVELLANGTPSGKKDAATALYYLSILDEHKYRIVQAGAVKYLIELMHPDVGLVDEAVCILSNLSSIFEGSSEICREGGIPILVEILELGSSRAKEDAAVALLQLCTDNMQCCNMVLRLGVVSPLTALSNCSNPRARQLAQRLLNYLREYCNRKGDGQGVDLGRMSLQTYKDRLALSRDISDRIEVSSHSSASFRFTSTIETRRKSFKLSEVSKLFKIFKQSNVEKFYGNSFSSCPSFHTQVSYRVLHEATNSFSNTNLIGYGSFGTVYSGTFEQGLGPTVMVKVLDLLKNGASMSFHSECEVLRNIRHRNLVPILTCCVGHDFEGNEFKALVYKFMENGNLDTWLYTQSAAKTNVPSVLQRLNIAIDIASTLDYLHNDCKPPVIHCDLKPSNIFLDKDLTARVGDFGLSRFYSPTIEDGEQACIVGLQGSIDYVPPEYWMGAKATTFGDVYSFGILLLEMFTARRPTDNLFSNECSICKYVATALPERVMNIVDPLLLAYLESIHGSDKLSDSYGNLVKFEENNMHSFFLSIFKIGLSCASTSPLDRMRMEDVAKELHKIKKMLPESYKR
ncbi:PREDICTED: uncharacterized protein LOC109152269 isoform X2 [Ipomoea nil]|uniref:uncharacterized protein LOC109152269 isoform X2 n=1 Tax=Ipomoea nil TaxID=35883 RepID=UPI00090150FE|nr:PREDICTED: uncharacterized protein LOC109152269 isoform X2 [Ipomoea nil]